MLPADKKHCCVQEVAQILSDALPEYKFKAHKEEEKKQYCDNSKVTYAGYVSRMYMLRWLSQIVACTSATCSADHLNRMQIPVKDVRQSLPNIRTNVASSGMQTIQELGMALTPPEVFLPAMVRCMIRLGLAKPVEQ